ncbi:hypothetical protein KAU11_04565 [Candidatus Babeliales bacterium]|nr:hypothetical protein [Candidatus Babeliales bacterium]
MKYFAMLFLLAIGSSAVCMNPDDSSDCMNQYDTGDSSDCMSRYGLGSHGELEYLCKCNCAERYFEEVKRKHEKNYKKNLLLIMAA